MRRLWCLLIAVIAFAGASATSASAQLGLVGSLNCRVFGTTQVLLENTRSLMCTFFPESSPGVSPLPKRLIGTMTRVTIGLPATGSTSAWGVYTNQSQFAATALVGIYTGVVFVGPKERLTGGVGNSIELHPLAGVPGEDPGVNFAFGVSRLTLR